VGAQQNARARIEHSAGEKFCAAHGGDVVIGTIQHAGGFGEAGEHHAIPRRQHFVIETGGDPLRARSE